MFDDINSRQGLWPVRYSAEELAALRWLLANDPNTDVPANATDPLADEHDSATDLRETIAIGIVELEETGKIELDPSSDRVTIMPPHDLIVLAARTGVQTVVRHATSERADVYVFMISPLLADIEVGLELWRRADGSVWVNTWPLDEMAVRLVEHLEVPRLLDTRNANRNVVHIHLDSIAAALDDPTNSLGDLLGQLESYSIVEAMLLEEDSLALAGLRVLVTSTGVWLVDEIEAVDSAENSGESGNSEISHDSVTDIDGAKTVTVTLTATDSTAVIRRLDALFEVL